MEKRAVSYHSVCNLLWRMMDHLSQLPYYFSSEFLMRVIVDDLQITQTLLSDIMIYNVVNMFA